MTRDAYAAVVADNTSAKPLRRMKLLAEGAPGPRRWSSRVSSGGNAFSYDPRCSNPWTVCCYEMIWRDWRFGSRRRRSPMVSSDPSSQLRPCSLNRGKAAAATADNQESSEG
jgi:hypothetical protein